MMPLAILINRFGYAALQWVMMIIISRNMSQETLGCYTYTLAIAGPIFLLAQSNLVSFLLADKFSKFSPNIYIKHRILFAILGLATLALLCFMFSNDLLVIATLVGIIKLCESIYDLDLGFLQHGGKAKKIIVKCILRYSILAFTSYIFFTENNFIIGLLSIAITNLAMLITLDLKTQKESNHSTLDKKDNTVIGLLKKTAPLGLVMIIASIGTNTPVYYIEHYNDKSEVAIFSILFYFIIVGRMFIAAFCQAKIPKISYLFFSNKIKFTQTNNHLQKRIVALGITSLGVLYFLGNKIITIIYGEKFTTSSHTMLLIGLYMIISFLSQTQNTITTAIGKGSLILYIELINLLILSITLPILVPRYSINGAFYSLLVSGLVHCILSFSLQYKLRSY